MNTNFANYPTAELSSPDGTHCLKLATYSFAYPDAKDSYDRDWHRNLFSLSLPAFTASIDDIMIEGTEMMAFLKGLQSFLAKKQKEVFFAPTEPYLELNFERKRKIILVTGAVQYPAGCGARLEFEFETSMDKGEWFAAGLEKILQQFPPVNKL
ncbi:hypothetical protein LRR81_09040 [Metabacillus sp. GX 13764]|uniref:WapI family immunity protein n=1 Tax=Metabacillus kandeliae TaxID=2900151 RepID=UPI001E4D9370|nr:hypothetical protein [Metabacillus kandeliae]MCD7034380.1 hypothetical protein [Metabacillus kandeliae]